jgi:uncharacterized membrane protein
MNRHRLWTIHTSQTVSVLQAVLVLTVLDKFFLFKLLLYLLYQFSEHIIVHITLIIILVVSLLSLSRNETNSHFLNNWQSQNNTTSQADRIWSEHLIWPWKATIWIRFIKEIGISWNESNESYFRRWKWSKYTDVALKDQILISVSVFRITIPLVTATAYYHCTCSVHFIHTTQFQLYVRISKSSSSSNIKSMPSSSLVMQQLIIYMFISTSELTKASHFDDKCHRLSWGIREYLSRSWPY